MEEEEKEEIEPKGPQSQSSMRWGSENTLKFLLNMH